MGDGTAERRHAQRRRAEALTALDGLANAASLALDAAQAREGLTPAQVDAAQNAALDDLGETEDETLFAMTDLCGTIFGVNFD